MKRELETALTSTVQALFATDVEVELTRPDEKFGDYATNVALQLAPKVGKQPRQVAESLAEKLQTDLADKIADVLVAGSGFINFKLSDAALRKVAEAQPAKSLAGKVVVAEYSDPNPFKVLHAGHLYTSVVGDAIANLLEQAGGQVHRVNFGGDVGLHVAKSMWAILKFLGGEQFDKLTIPESKRADWLSERYVEGNQAYENEAHKVEIIELNKRIYKLFDDNDHDSDFAQIYWTCRQWSYDYFDRFYGWMGSKFEKYYPESEVAPLGLQTVKAHIDDEVYKASDGAVIFDGEKYGLHTRVFINSDGLPTYEAKDVGLIMKKWQDYHFDLSVVITGNDIIEYMKVVLKSIEQFMPELPQRSRHLTHGMVKLQGGAKMSSRQGNILRAIDVLNAAAEAAKQLSNQENVDVVLAAVKYAFLKNRLGSELIYYPQESVSLEGNSGPYLQYAHARARSILNKASVAEKLSDEALQAEERSLLRKIGEYPEVVDQAVAELLPHHICTYLYDLAQIFNRFYEHNRVLGDNRQAIRLILVDQYAETLKKGLHILGIAAPDKM